MIIALGHRAFMGKDTLARFIAAELRDKTRGISIESRSFAFKLKETAFSLYAWAGLQRPEYYEEHQHLKNVVLLKIGKSPRQLWIEIGQKLREIDSYIWINAVLKNSQPQILIIRDLRFPHEVNMIHEQGGVVVKCFRPNYEEYGIKLSNDEADIALEGYNRWDYIAESNNLQEVKEHAKTIVQKFCKRFLNV
jgi:hypothetical protein